MKKAVYAGSFDPITLGHLWMIEEGLKLTEELVVAIGVNPDKSAMFSVESRMEMLEACLPKDDRLTLDSFDNMYLVNYARSIGADCIIRGIRSEVDYEYERVMRHINSDIEKRITTVFLMPPRDIAEVSSSIVKGLIGPDGWQEMVKHYVPKPVYKYLINDIDQ
jgi:pantetheine-phosphate adenylyltransferase